MAPPPPASAVPRRAGASPRNARCATTGSPTGRPPRVPRPARRRRSSSATGKRWCNRDGAGGGEGRGLRPECHAVLRPAPGRPAPRVGQDRPEDAVKVGGREGVGETAKERVAELHDQGMTEARLYGANDSDGVGGIGSVFLLLDEPEVYGLPPDPQVCTKTLPRNYGRAGLAALGMLLSAAIAFRGRR